MGMDMDRPLHMPSNFKPLLSSAASENFRSACFICPFQEKIDKSFNFKILQLLNMQGAGQVVSISVLEAKVSRARPLSYV